MNGFIAIIPIMSDRLARFLYATDRLRTQCVEIIHGKGRESNESELPSLSSPPSCHRDGVFLKGGQKGVRKPGAKAKYMNIF